LVGWGVLIGILISLLVWGVIQLANGSPPQEPPTPTTPGTTTTTTTATTPTTTTATTTPPTSTTSTTSPTHRRHDRTTTTTPTTTSTPTAGNSQEPGGLPHLPEQITLPWLSTTISLPPGL
jgi:hypothetical protein